MKNGGELQTLPHTTVALVQLLELDNAYKIYTTVHAPQQKSYLGYIITDVTYLAVLWFMP